MQERNPNSDYLFWLPLLGGLALFFVAHLNAIQAPSPLENESIQNPENIAARQVPLETSSIEERRQFWKKAVDQDPDNAEAQYQLGILLAFTDPDNAPAPLKRSAELEPTYEENVEQILNTLRVAAFAETPAYQAIQIGQVLASVGEWTIAKEAFLVATQTDPNYAEAWAFLGEAQNQLGEDPTASFETALSLNPKSFSANFFLGLYWLRNQQAALALDYFETAEQIEPGNKIVLSNIGYSLAALGQTNEAIAQFQYLTYLYPEDSFTWLTLAEFSIQNELQVEQTGLPAARQAVLMDKNDPRPLALLGRGHTLLGDKTLSIRFLNQALALDPESPQTHYYLALHYIALGNDPDKIRTHLETVLQIGGEPALIQQVDSILGKYSP